MADTEVEFKGCGNKTERRNISLVMSSFGLVLVLYETRH